MEEVRRRYRLLAHRYHPDHNPGDPEAAARFRLVLEAFEAIQAARSEADSQAKARARTRRNASQYRQPRFSDRAGLFEEFFGIGQDTEPLSWSAGPDFRYDLEIPFVSAIRGMGAVIAVDHHPTCPQCEGTGLYPGANYRECPDCQGRGRRYGGPGLLRFGPVCERCRGLGKIVASPCQHCGGLGSYSCNKKYHLRIPPGTRDGARFQVPGEGGAGFRNGPPGNLLVVIHVTPHDFFTRVGNDIYCKIEVSVDEAALGGGIRIPTLDGFQMVNLPQGIQTGWTCRFLGAGAPGDSQQPLGDQINEIIVNPTNRANAQERSFLKGVDRREAGQMDRAGHE
jgi:molecular chaperone DnaJ